MKPIEDSLRERLWLQSGSHLLSQVPSLSVVRRSAVVRPSHDQHLCLRRKSPA
jgi:hypothetical protein